MRILRRVFTVRCTDEELLRLTDYAGSVGRTSSDILREFVRSLPEPKKPASRPVRKQPRT